MSDACGANRSSVSKIVIVGASLAGLRTAEALRRHGSDADILVIGDEAHLPYDRPPLSKGVLLGSIETEGLQLTTAEQLTEANIEVRLGVAAASLDPSGHTVTLADGNVITYDQVIIATGSRARTLPGSDLDGVFVLRTLDDALALKAALVEGARVVVLGGGVIGAEVASSARQLGLEVTIVDLAPVLMQRVIGDAVGERMAQLHRENGVSLRLGVSSASIVGDGKVEGVVVEAGGPPTNEGVAGGGETLPADAVVLGIGAVPNVEWLEGSGLTIEDGVVCDEHLQAAPDVYAVGDVARWHHVGYQQTLRAEHWTTAIEHADAVARTLTGTPTTVGTVPYVWTDQYGKKLQIAGRLNPGDELIFVLDQEEPRKFVALSGSNGTQHAVIAFAAPPAFIKQKQAMASGQAPWPPVQG